jgi:hypothetical protein
LILQTMYFKVPKTAQLRGDLQRNAIHREDGRLKPPPLNPAVPARIVRAISLFGSPSGSVPRAKL